VKSGTLGVGGLDVTGNAGLTGRLTVSNAAPTMYFQDTNSARSSFIHQNSDTFYVLSDRNNDGAWDTDGSWPMQLIMGATAGNDMATFSNRLVVTGPASEMRAERYCDASGGNCQNAAQIPGGTPPSFQSFWNDESNTPLGVGGNRVCMLSAMDDGGCDAGASCALSINGSGNWVVNQNRGGDCDSNLVCTYACW
jgi:hypothetical protein